MVHPSSSFCRRFPPGRNRPTFHARSGRCCVNSTATDCRPRFGCIAWSATLGIARHLSRRKVAVLPRTRSAISSFQRNRRCRSPIIPPESGGGAGVVALESLPGHLGRLAHVRERLLMAGRWQSARLEPFRQTLVRRLMSGRETLPCTFQVQSARK